MKKIILLVLFAFLALLSCKKDHLCFCSTVANGETTTTTHTIYNTTDTKAKVDCESVTVGPNGATTTCALE